MDLAKAVAQLLARYADSRIERPAVRGEAVLAAVTVDQRGKLIEAPAGVVSSFAWGAPRALAEDLAVLSEWRTAEKPLLEDLDKVLRHTDDEGEEIPLDRSMIAAAWEWLVERLGLARNLVAPPRFAIRCFEYYKSSDPPEPLLLNSFFLGDLGLARRLFEEGRSTPNLRRYLGCEAPAQCHDLLDDSNALEAAVAPERIPPARWPGPGRHPLVLLQQAAVNLALEKDLEEDGILAVNGPPGTGKTTLLRDLVAGIVTRRAETMASFDDPASAFTHSGERLRAGSAWLHLYRLDPKLKGEEMLVASSNNKAVENVSAEFPGLQAIAEDATGLRYFNVLSDELLDRKTWGLIAAVLGKAANRGRFTQTFWWNEEVGFSTYLAEAAGTPQLVDSPDAETGSREPHPPRIVEAEDPPRSHEEALRRWRKARSKFQSVLAESRRNLAELERARKEAPFLPARASEEAAAGTVAKAAQQSEESARGAVEAASARRAEAQRVLAATEEMLVEHDRQAPGFLARLLRTKRARAWSSARIGLAAACAQARQALFDSSQALSAAEEELRRARVGRQEAERHWKAARERHAAARRVVAAVRERIGSSFIDAEFFTRPHDERHQTAPWTNAAIGRLRDEVFIAAMALHKAFAEAAAKPLRHNLGVLMNVFGGRALPSVEKEALRTDLWASLFLVVPLLSTTFASVERMLGALPPQSLGWLIVDEAGQALPQAAVGALLRTRRAVMVGDPLQIEPVVMLPDTLTHAICREFGVDPDRFAAPQASAQTLADAATPYCAEFPARQGSRTVGVPLLVHRRCTEPMFRISNAIAYSRLMVNAKRPAPTRIGEVLGVSRWIDVRGSAVEKWCPEEGETVLGLLRLLVEQEVVPDLYIVTPFVIVADNLRKLVRESRILEAWKEDPWRWTAERIGTIHTVQGREAEAVIFVLGAPAAQQAGARGWAGGPPNLLNVAVTRAKERLYVIGNRQLWRKAGLFSKLDDELPPE